MFTLHPQLAQDTHSLLSLPLCELRLLTDSECPWLVLIPKREGITEIHQLSEADQNTLIAEITSLTKKMELEFQPDKINVGALGNMVPQLHIHLICRYSSDRAWPGPIWGVEGTQNIEKQKDIQAKIYKMLEIENL